MRDIKFHRNFWGILLTGFMLMVNSAVSYAFSPEHYATNSRLSQGNWVKVEVVETGMQFISDATLRSLGFNDPEKVNVFGYGGVVIPENLNSPDDLPKIASLRIEGGLVFFGKGSVGWERISHAKRTYGHLSHPYSDVSYYFLSDSDSERRHPATAEKVSAVGSPITSYTERLVHEEDLMMAMNTGRMMLGEDFKVTTSRTFNFQLPGNTGKAIVTTAFASKTTSGTPSLTFTANGNQLTSTTSDRMAYSSSKLIVSTTTVKEVEDAGEELSFNIKFNGAGTVSKAGLDYIEVEYPRALVMGGEELYFYINPTYPSEVKIEGTGTSVKVWDVTDAENPLEMEVKSEAGGISFVTSAGYHEFIAFDPNGVKRNMTGNIKVTNQDIHSMPAPDLLVICPPEYLSAARRLEALHRDTDGLSVLTLTPEEIYNEFSGGKPDVSAFRKLLKMWYDRAGGRRGEYTAHCLIMSRPTYDNKMVTAQVRNCGYPRIPIWQSSTGETATSSYSTDDYIGMLDDVGNTFNIGNAKIHVAVGRMPVKSLAEANTAIDKMENYLLNKDLGAWKNNVIVIADDQDSGVHLEQAEGVIAGFKSAGKGNDYLYEKLYLDSYEMEYTSVGASYPLAHERLLNKWNEGALLIDYIGHANPKSWGHEFLLTWQNILSMNNKRLPFLYAATCEFNRWDDDDVSGAEVLWLHPNSGIIGSMSPSREVLISSNGVLNKSTSAYMFATDENGRSLTLGEVMVRGKNDSNTGTNKLRYGFLGDPTLRLVSPEYNVEVTSINGIELVDAENYPTLKARSTVDLKGQIEDAEGNKIQDFNGIVEIQLYDAEKVITTNANGSEGVHSLYNDRKTRLFVGRAKVTDGEWGASFTMPSEIENNYSPALLSLYASDAMGREGSGSCEKLYAFGYDETAPEDYEGPKIIEFYLDRASFKNGSDVSPTPVLYAKFYDESGISVSEAGIGHGITLDLDGKKYYDDIAQFYVPDENTQGMGSLVYSLGDIEEGHHTLRLIVWDNANNSTAVTLDFKVSALWKPSIETLTTDVNPATSSVNFIVATDGSTASMECAVEVYDIWGKKVWRGSAPALSGNNTRTTLGWDLSDFAGAKVPGGIYIYKAIVKTNSGATVTKAKKLIVR